MSCLNMERLHSYLEGELAGPEKKAAENHLASCPKCRAAVEDRRFLDEVVKTLPQFEVPSDFAQKVMARIPPSAPVKVKLFGRRAATAAGLTTFIVTLFLAALLTGHGLSRFLLGLNRFIWKNIHGLAFVFAKVTKYLSVALKILGQIARELVEGLKFLTSFIGPETQIICLCTALLIIIAGGFLWNRKYSMEKHHEK